nr:hypothetical protein [Tanacetum cinerariifolium]
MPTFYGRTLLSSRDQECQKRSKTSKTKARAKKKQVESNTSPKKKSVQALKGKRLKVAAKVPKS